jgi:hypothetical protein
MTFGKATGPSGEMSSSAIPPPDKTLLLKMALFGGELVTVVEGLIGSVPCESSGIVVL